MRRLQTIGTSSLSVLAGALTVLGLWLPWLRKRPVGFVDGQPYYTMEWVDGLTAGFHGPDALVALLVLAVVTVAVAADRSPLADGLLAATGLLLSAAYGGIVRHYAAADRYALEPGIYVVLAGALLFTLTGASGALFRRIAGK